MNEQTVDGAWLILPPLLAFFTIICYARGDG
jgi:hypothetical protein